MILKYNQQCSISFITHIQSTLEKNKVSQVCIYTKRKQFAIAIVKSAAHQDSDKSINLL